LLIERREVRATSDGEFHESTRTLAIAAMIGAKQGEINIGCLRTNAD
jgi:hypothetical protein